MKLRNLWIVGVMVLGLQISINAKTIDLKEKVIVGEGNYLSSFYRDDIKLTFEVERDGIYSIYTKGQSLTDLRVINSRGKDKINIRNAHGNNGLIVMKLKADEVYTLEVDNIDEDILYRAIIQYGLPMSGAEPTYGDKPFNGRHVKYTNCYAYALNMLHKPDGNSFGFNGINPGYFSDKSFRVDDEVLSGHNHKVKADLVYLSELDGEALGYEFREIDKYDMPSRGYYKVALLRRPEGIKLGTDYHWVRQDSNGLWSHKVGVLDATDKVEGEVIVEPDKTDFNTYTEFLGYFEVKNLDKKESL